MVSQHLLTVRNLVGHNQHETAWKRDRRSAPGSVNTVLANFHFRGMCICNVKHPSPFKKSGYCKKHWRVWKNVNEKYMKRGGKERCLWRPEPALREDKEQIQIGTVPRPQIPSLTLCTSSQHPWEKRRGLSNPEDGPCFFTELRDTGLGQCLVFLCFSPNDSPCRIKQGLLKVLAPATGSHPALIFARFKMLQTGF
jgi:hypothetical protein